MNQAEIIAIGDELLIGQVLNTNAEWLSQELSVRGVRLKRHLTIADSKEEIIRSLNDLLPDTNFVFITGGLGPTKDDITKHVLTDYFDDVLELNEERLETLSAYYESRGRQLNELNKTQAILPKKAKKLDNAVGTACGMWFKKGELNVISLPGVPHEMKYLLNEHVFSTLEADSSIGTYVTIRTVGIPESDLAIKLEEWENSLSVDYKLAYLPSLGQVRLRLTSFHSSNNHRLLEIKVQELKELIGVYIFGFGEVTLPEAVGKALMKNGLTISAAESCTGGSIAKALTSFGGSSSFFQGSIVAYHNHVKESLLGVSKEDLNTYGAVSEPVIQQMAVGVKNKLGTDYAIATSGIAGPDGGTTDKPVGTIWIAVAGPQGVTSKKLSLGNRRKHNIELTVVYALDLLRLELSTNY